MSRLIPFLAPAYLFACLTLGGSAQGIWRTLFLQFAAIVLLVLALAFGRPAEGLGPRRLRWIAISALVVIGLQLVPLPPAVWAELPGRGPIVAGFALLGEQLPWMPISMTPEKSVSALLALLPAAAMLGLMLRWPAQKPELVAAAALIALIISVFFGLMQITQGQSWYVYRIASRGAAAGLFANSNHMASFLLASIPLLAALGAGQLRRSGPRQDSTNQRLPILLALLACAALVATGIALNGSFAILLIGGPMLAASALIFLPPASIRLGRLSPLIFTATALGAVAVLAIGGDRLARLAGQTSVVERKEIWTSSAQLAVDYAPVGSGLGSFPAVYRLQEDPDKVTWQYVNHAHSDFLEVVIELGVPGLLLLMVFLGWWLWRFAAIWRSSGSPPLVRASTLVTLGLLLHSLVDFPLRTAALSALFATAVGMMAVPRPAPRPAERGQPRHLRLEDL